MSRIAVPVGSKPIEAETLPETWTLEAAALSVPGADPLEVEALIRRGVPSEGLARGLYVGVMIEFLPQLRKFVLDPATKMSAKMKAANLLTRMMSALEPKAVTPLQAGNKRLSFTVSVESAGELPMTAALEEVRGLLQGAHDATQEGEVVRGAEQEHRGDDQGRAPVEAGAGGSVPRIGRTASEGEEG